MAFIVSTAHIQAREATTHAFLGSADASVRARLVVDSLASMDSSETAEAVLNIAGYEVSFT